ncbi:hypothetical protein, partial [Klebsiella pneumoniae]|uniref:hypothetical protein n=1 Tax=Klebsiella pneumoniae TaxID=573 RepID=UPI003013851E
APYSALCQLSFTVKEKAKNPAFMIYDSFGFLASKRKKIIIIILSSPCERSIYNYIYMYYF